MMLSLKWEGHFNFQNNLTHTSVFDSSLYRQKGICFSTVKKDKHYLIHYVGVTIKSFSERFLKHIEDMYCCKSTIYDYELSKEILERIESEIIIKLKNNSNASTLLANCRLSRFKLTTDEQLEISVPNGLFCGFGINFVA